ncbi:hypothetical protein diail_5643 [Diaporthe ilicicola]|nr:hypothetical protein diail_5643 [Diaporthe ilicicola]
MKGSIPHYALQLLVNGILAAALPTAVDTTNNVIYMGTHENRFKPPKLYTPQPGSEIVAQSYGPSWSGSTVAAFGGQNSEISVAPDGMILESAENGLPIVHVAFNYRLSVFGFARSAALESEGSENAGLRDQRLAIEWVHDNIEHFGGDPDKITIAGRSTGGLSVGMQVMAYGASKPVAFQQAICESQALEPGITGNFTADAMRLLVDYLGCNTTSFDSEETLANVTSMIGRADNDVSYLTEPTIKTANDTRAFFQTYAPSKSDTNVDKLLKLYPVSEFQANPEANLEANLEAETYRAARVFRDIRLSKPSLKS